MPQIQRHLKSLLDCALENVTRNMEEWCKHYIETYGKENKLYLYVIGPFDPLPSKLLVQIINCLKEERRLKKHYLELLITQQLNTLNLSRETDEISTYLRLASIRCSDLKILDLSGCLKISKQAYQEFFPTFEKLQVLNLANTTAGNSCLFILGAYCKDLRELDVTNCSSVTDAGIQGLCLSVDDLGKRDDRLGQCKLIHKLMVSYTKITKKGIRIALENLPTLKVFECCSSAQVLAEMHKAAIEHRLPDIPKYSLIDLHCTDETFSTPYTSGSLGAAVFLCPSLIKVRIVTQEGLQDSDLLALLALERLCELSIGGGEVCEITFDEGVAPLLQGIGSTLASLTLAELPCVNVRTVVEFCPNVRFLFLLMNHAYSTVALEERRQPFSLKPIKNEPTLKALESLHLVCLPNTWVSSAIPPESLPWLFSSPALLHVYVKGCVTLTDDVFRKANLLHNFKNLEHIELEECNSVTKEGIEVLMNVANPLKVVKLWKCQSLARKTVEDWNKRAKKKKWEVSIEWS